MLSVGANVPPVSPHSPSRHNLPDALSSACFIPPRSSRSPPLKKLQAWAACFRPHRRPLYLSRTRVVYSCEQSLRQPKRVDQPTAAAPINAAGGCGWWLRLVAAMGGTGEGQQCESTACVRATPKRGGGGGANSRRWVCEARDRPNLTAPKKDPFQPFISASAPTPSARHRPRPLTDLKILSAAASAAAFFAPKACAAAPLCARERLRRTPRPSSSPPSLR